MGHFMVIFLLITGHIFTHYRSYFYSFFIFVKPENFMCLAREWLKSLNFGCPVWGTSHFGTPKFCQTFSFLYIHLP